MKCESQFHTQRNLHCQKRSKLDIPSPNHLALPFFFIIGPDLTRKHIFDVGKRNHSQPPVPTQVNIIFSTLTKNDSASSAPRKENMCVQCSYLYDEGLQIYSVEFESRNDRNQLRRGFFEVAQPATTRTCQHRLRNNFRFNPLFFSRVHALFPF